ncbi:glycine betaine ABC transporter substrate-binding protein [Caldisalinibacter kiritimatiensis]|uniref:Glycine betaine ABC transport system, glycine betaine-binding protein OpuAC n=1 Tax=Caldisalinibacter kiritimatiensis TaxID=1304284 RepID=R1AVF9_9FIRM|nr:glycine betaine ABC transporter substrate-binding protein [Caldisalinibacter kiritimatiensis]EOD01188.1 Glycine betaine ABC transport system, glycine betaine-binding protein OpuAC [Caldisalinibacter kiritimatiensis]
MRRFTKIITLMLLVVLLGTVLFSGCSNQTEEKDTVKLAYVNWAEGVAMTNLMKAVLEEKMGYEVEMTMADPGVIFTSIANGDYDAFLDAWLPVTHESYLEKYKDDLVDLGYNFEGARIGLVVPEYVEINSIEELNSVKDKFNGEIIGIDSGAGIMNATNKAIEEYGLDYDLLAGSGPVMTASLKDAIDNNENIIVTGWKPHWKFARYDLKFLDDPKKVYGEVENIHTMARKGLEEDMPEVAELFRNFKLNDQQLGSLMGMIADSDEEPDVVAKKWMEENEELVNSWLPQE